MDIKGIKCALYRTDLGNFVDNMSSVGNSNANVSAKSSVMSNQTIAG